ncbi:MAG TPA: AAA family ATPase, partial [Urbifossiella sp.]|nr:AAA family ATPase [Urbifossiella sp.]
MNRLWRALVDAHADRLVVVIHADDLREVGAQVSRSLSWERTAHDLAAAFGSHHLLRELGRARHVVVRFGVSGAVHVVRDDTRRAPRFVLYYDPANLEGEFRVRAQQGEMVGYNSVLAATLATEIRAGLAAGGPGDATADALDGGGAVRKGIANCRAFFRYGFGPAARDHPTAVTRWDQIGNRRRPRTYPPQLCALAKMLYEPVGDRTFGVFVVTPVDRTQVDSEFALDGADEAELTKRSRGGLLIDPGGHIAEVTGRMTGEVTRWWKAVRTDWGVLHPADAVPEDAPPLIWDAATSPWRAVGRVAIHPRVKVADLPGLRLEVERRMRDALRPYTRDRLDKELAGAPPEPSWFHTARAFVSEVDDWVYQDVDWDYGWPVCVRAFAADAARFARVDVPGTDPNWKILGGNVSTLLSIATEIVVEGAKDALAKTRNSDAGGDGRFPVAVFGLLRTADRWEGESYRSIRNLIREYLGKPNPERPLSIAVFGPPGGGKSFGVKQIAQSLDKDRVVEDENNLSQFTSPADLSRAFIRMRDKAVGGKVPLVFFDEFDAQHGPDKLAWLKYFLSVMQDGTHRFDGQDLRVGQAILVFAGGTSRTYRAFAREETGGAVTDEDRRAFAAAKGPDFVSRLRGYVDIIGPNPQGADAKVHSDPG